MEQNNEKIIDKHYKIGVRYCGGCNPRYDRVSLINKFKEVFSECEFSGIDPNVKYDAVLIACGCQSKCADISGIQVLPGKMFHLVGWEDFLPVKNALTQAIASQNEVLSLDAKAVEELLPHKEPARLVEHVKSLKPGEEAEAVFIACKDMPIFKGHFPDSPVLPGVYTLEALAQTGGIIALSTDRYKGKLPIFIGVKDASFRAPVLPGDELTLRVSMIKENEKTSILEFKGQAVKDDVLVCEAQFRLIMR